MRSAWRPALFGFLLTLAVQLFVLSDRLIRDPLIFDPILDAFENWRWAHAFFLGEAEPVFQRGPFYLVLLAFCIRVFGSSLSAVFVLQAVLSSLTAGMIAGLAGRAAGWLAGIGAAVFFAFYPPALHFSGEILDATVSAFLMTLVMVVTEWARMRAWKPTSSLAVGALLGVLSLCRPNALVLILVMMAWLLIVERKNFASLRDLRKSLVALSLGAVLSILPATAWNRIVGGDQVLITASGGINLYVGNRRGANGISANAPELGTDWWEHGFRKVRELAEQARGHELKPSEVSTYWAERAWDEIKADPLDWLGLMGWKAWVSFLDVEIPNNKAVGLSLRYSRLGTWLLPGFGFLLAGALAAIAMGRLKNPLLALAAGLVGAWILSMIPFVVNGRYRFTIIPCLCVLAGAGWAGIFQDSRLRMRGLAGVCAGLLLAWSGPILKPAYFLERAEKEEAHNQQLLANHFARMQAQDKEKAPTSSPDPQSLPTHSPTADPSGKKF